MPFRHLIRGVFITLLAVLTALPFVAAPVNAAPNSDKVRADVQKGANDVTVKVLNGTVVIKDGQLEFRNNAGKVTDSVALTYIGTDARTYPIDATVKGNVAKLVPSKDVKRSIDTPESVLNAGKVDVAKQKTICGPQTKKQRDKEALDRLTSELGAAAAIGGLAGVIVGAVIGIVFSGGVLAVISAPLGALIGAGGAIAGAAINGAFARYFGTINQKKFKPKTCYI